MTDNARTRAWLCLAVVYFCIGVALGVVMGATGDHSLFPLHAHLNLLGWVSMSLFGIIGGLYPAITRGTVATLQFWIYNVGLPVMLVSLAAKLKGYASVDPVLGLASTVVGIGVLLFAFQVITTMRIRTAAAATVASGAA